MTGTRIVNHDLRQLMSALGVSPEAVARQVARQGSKERGVSHIRIYQLLASDSFLDRRRVLYATAEAARAAGVKEVVIELLSHAIVDDVAHLTHPAAGYAADLIRR